MQSPEALLGIELQIIQASTAGAHGKRADDRRVQCGRTGLDRRCDAEPGGMRKEHTLICSQTTRPFNMSFFCHVPQSPSARRCGARRLGLKCWLSPADGCVLVIAPRMAAFGPRPSISRCRKLAGSCLWPSS